MTVKSEFKERGYEWIHLADNVALLRAPDGRVEQWRVVGDGETVSVDSRHMMRSARRTFVFVQDVTFMPLPEWGRSDLKVGQTVELEAKSKWWAKGGGYGAIESTYQIFGTPQYRVRLANGELASLKPRQVKPLEGDAVALAAAAVAQLVIKPPKETKPRIGAERGLIYVGPDFSVPRYTLFQNSKGEIERWQVLRTADSPAGDAVMAGRADGVWYVFVEIVR